jgi:hypothetical protein
MIFQGICQNVKELSEVCDQVINKFISMNIRINDTEGKHSLMVFILERHGYKLKAKSCTKDIKSCDIQLDDAFTIDELLQELHTECVQNIENSERYSVAY